MAATKIRGNTQIIAGTITNAEINASAAIASSKLADGANFLKKDGSVALTSTLDLGTHVISNVVDPTNPQDAATKNYVDGMVQGLDIKASVRVATTANITLSGTQTVDGVALSVNDRVLVKDQSTGANNGIYTVQSSAWTRTTDADTSAKVTAGLFTFISEGTTNGDTGWVLSTNDAITLGSTSLAFVQFSSASAITGGAGLLKTGSTLDVQATDTSITVGADSIGVNLASGGTLAISSGLKVASAGITATELATGAFLSTGGLTGGGGTAASIKIDTGETVKSITTGAAGAKVNVVKWIVRETPSGSVNDVNTTFTLVGTPVSNTEQVFLNGILQEPGAGNDYTISSATITYLTAPATGDRLRVSYITS